VSGQLHAPAASTPGKESPRTHFIGGWLGPRAGPDDVEKRKSLTQLGLELRPLGRPACSQSLYRLNYPNSSFILINTTHSLSSALYGRCLLCFFTAYRNRTVPITVLFIEESCNVENFILGKGAQTWLVPFSAPKITITQQHRHLFVFYARNSEAAACKCLLVAGFIAADIRRHKLSTAMAAYPWSPDLQDFIT
jgi:hypothetical protein